MTTATDTDMTDEQPPDPAETDLGRAWITILAEFWRATDWDQFQQQKARAETFDERALVAVRAGSVHGALDKLAKGLNMASPELPTRELDMLVADEDASMRVLRRERIYLVNKVQETIHNYFEAKSRDEHDHYPDADPEPTTSQLTDFITTTENDT